MSSRGAAVALHRGAPSSPGGPVLEADLGGFPPVAFGGLRALLNALEDAAPDVVGPIAGAHPVEWERLFPGRFPDAPSLSDVGLSPSERRLHRESEQVFRVLNAAARAVVHGARAAGRPVVLRNARHCDLVSLRGVMRAVEWARLAGGCPPIVVGEWDGVPAYDTPFAPLRALSFDALARRMRAPLEGSAGAAAQPPASPGDDAEAVLLGAALDDGAAAPARVAGALAAARACFFSTNYDGAALAAARGLRVLERTPALDAGEVRASFTELRAGEVHPAVEIDESVLGSRAEVAALLWRSLGVVQSFNGRNDLALESFERALVPGLPPEAAARVRMYRALVLVKKRGHGDAARAEIDAGLDGLAGARGDVARLEEGWLRNVCGLTYFFERDLRAALDQERHALDCVGGLHDPKATHLKINLISNVSVLQETAGKFRSALETWGRFEQIGDAWDDNFRKHHLYRTAGLERGAGDEASALAHLQETHAVAERLRDAYHQQVVAAELGALFLDRGETHEAALWFKRAVERAHDLGDPFRAGESLAGYALASGEGAVDDALATAAESSTYEDGVRALRDAHAAGGVAALLAALPRPRTKLNRPFDLVNLYLPS